MTTYVFMALDQLVRSDQTKSINAFSKIVSEELGISLSAARRHIMEALLKDNAKEHIEAYKLGEINTQEFKQKLSHQLAISERSDFENAWNVMCDIDNTQDAFTLFKIQEYTPINFYFVSSTNQLQFDHITNQLNRLLSHYNKPSMAENPELTFVNSFTEHELDKSSLADLAVKRDNLDQVTNHIILLHQSFDCKELGIENARCTEGNYTGFLNCFTSHFDILNPSQECVSYF